MNLGREEREMAEDTGNERDDGYARWYNEWVKSHNRSQVEDIMDRRFFYSPKGYIGLADSRSRYTDLIAVFFGASVPIILRKVSTYYKLIGEACVHGFMDGEAIRLMKNGELEVQAIDVV
jgi:hypothetical protein